MVENRISLIIGEDDATKDEKLKVIKGRFLAGMRGEGEFNIDDVHGRDLTLKGLGEILKRLPLNSRQRLLIVRGVDYLKDTLISFLLKFIQGEAQNHFCFVFTGSLDKRKSPNRLITYLRESKIANIIYCPTLRKQRVFDLAHTIEEGDSYTCLSLLKQLLKEGQSVPQLMGGLFWYWNNNLALKNRRKLQKDLELFLDTDTRIKTGKIAPELALELLVVKLCQ